MRRSFKLSYFNLARFMLFFVLSHFPCHIALGSDVLLSSGDYPAQYIAKLSGSVGRENFNDAQVLITLMPSSYQDINPYTIIIEGYPESNSNHIFFWTTKETTMEIYGNEFICKLKRQYRDKRPNVFFFYISPILLEVKHLTQHEEEAEQLAKDTALPTKVYANVGDLRVVFLGNKVKGSVRLVGYDFVENSYVHYNASFSGELVTRIKQKLEKRKNIGTNLVEPGSEQE